MITSLVVRVPCACVVLHHWIQQLVPLKLRPYGTIEIRYLYLSESWQDA